jgi:hypothetical protein
MVGFFITNYMRNYKEAVDIWELIKERGLRGFLGGFTSSGGRKK